MEPSLQYFHRETTKSQLLQQLLKLSILLLKMFETSKNLKLIIFKIKDAKNFLEQRERNLFFWTNLTNYAKTNNNFYYQQSKTKKVKKSLV